MKQQYNLSARNTQMVYRKNTVYYNLFYFWNTFSVEVQVLWCLVVIQNSYNHNYIRNSRFQYSVLWITV